LWLVSFLPLQKPIARLNLAALSDFDASSLLRRALCDFEHTIFENEHLTISQDFLIAVNNLVCSQLAVDSNPRESGTQHALDTAAVHHAAPAVRYLHLKKGIPMRKPIALFTLVVLGLAALAWGRNVVTNENRAITAVAQNYMDAYYTANPSLMQKTLHPEFHKRTLRTVNGQTQITEDTAQSMVEGVGLGSGRYIPRNERVRSIEVLDVYRDAASVKVVTGRWIDYMHLSKLNGEWRVLDVVLQYTRN
jgi:hypothetical protein